MAPFAVALAFRHAARALGVLRAALEMTALAAYGFALEVIAIAVFASHRYDASWRLAPLGVPVAVAGVWAAVIVAAMAVAWRYGAASPLARAATAALVGVALDLMIEPVATRLGLWSWTPPGPWLGVPIGNFVGWAVIVGAYAYGAERWTGIEGWRSAIPRRAALAAACIAALIAVGFAWTRLGLERAFEDGRGWIAWGAVLLATVSCRWWPHTSPGSVADSLPERLAAAPGRGPQWVLLAVGFAFLLGANAVRDRSVTVAAVGSILAVRAVASVRRESPSQAPPPGP